MFSKRLLSFSEKIISWHQSQTLVGVCEKRFGGGAARNTAGSGKADSVRRLSSFYIQLWRTLRGDRQNIYKTFSHGPNLDFVY